MPQVIDHCASLVTFPPDESRQTGRIWSANGSGSDFLMCNRTMLHANGACRATTCYWTKKQYQGIGVNVQQIATSNVQNRAFLGHFSIFVEKRIPRRGYAGVVHVWCVIAHASKWFTKPLLYH